MEEQNDTVCEVELQIDEVEELEQEGEIDLAHELEMERKQRIVTENKLYCIQLLEKSALPRELCDYLTGESEEETQKRVREVSEIIKKAVNEQVKGRLATISTPSQGKTAMSKSQFKSLSLAERQKIYRMDKELYNRLSKL